MYEDIELKKILKKSIEDFYKKDYYLVEKGLHEQTMTHRIAHYFENILGECELYSIDVEFNRKLNSSKDLYLCCHNCQNECISKITNHKRKRGRPDINFHERGFNNKNSNLLIIEAKKTVRTKNDKTKLTYLTCKDADYKYQLGALIILKIERVSITYFKDGVISSERTGIIDKNRGILWQEEKNITR